MYGKKIDYKQAGVNIDEGNELVKSLKDVVKATARPGADASLGSFGSIFDLKKTGYKDPLLVSGTDGVGTKLKLATQLGNHTTVGQDLVAMCVNDIVAQGAEPLFFLDYFATSKLKKEQAHEVIAGIADGCKKAGCALIGGETAELPGMYNDGEYDLAGFVVGAVERERLLPRKNEMQEGDVVIGLASSGPHSNGYSLIRKIIFDNNIDLHQKPPFDSEYQTFGNLLLQPTYIYSSALIPLCKKQMIKGIAHITGGGLVENIPRILPNHLSVALDNSTLQPDEFCSEKNSLWPQQPIFSWLQKMACIDNYELHRVFNCGIGMVLVVDEEHSHTILNYFATTKFNAYRIGKIIKTPFNKEPKFYFCSVAK